LGHISAHDHEPNDDPRLRIDLAPANVRWEDHLLIDTLRTSGEIPDNHYWSVVIAYRENDFRQTGNYDRFDRDHPWLAKILRKYDWEPGLLHDASSPASSLFPPVDWPPNLTTGIPVLPETPAIASVPEPSSSILLGIALVLFGLALPRLRRAL
jgi:PEP-CTERM motif